MEPPKIVPLQESARYHACQRAIERYGLQISRVEYWALCERILNHQAEDSDDCLLLKNQPPNRQVWALWYKGEWIPVVFDTEDHAIVTFLPSYYLRQHKEKMPW